MFSIRFCFVFLLLFPLATSQAHTPHDAVLAGAISPAFDTDDTLFCGVSFMQNFLLKSTDRGETWTTSQKGISSHAVKSIAFSPDFAADRTVFAGTDKGELFKTTDGGASWQLCNGSVQSSEICTIAVSPFFASDRAVYYGTEDKGVFLSINGGDTWHEANFGLQSRFIFRLVASPVFDVDHTLFAGTADGLYKSVNGGLSWFKLVPHKGIFVTNLALSPEFGLDQTVFAGTWGYGVFASTDGGATWQSRNTGLTELDVSAVSLSPEFTSDRTVLVATKRAGIFKSTDAGSLWTRINKGLDIQTDQTKVHYFDFLFSPDFIQDRTVLLVSYEGLHKSEANVTRWRHLNIYNQNLIRSVVCSPDYATDGTVFAGAYGGGVYRSLDSGNTWKAVNTSSKSVYPDPMVTSPAYSRDRTVLGGYYRSVQKSTDGGNSWKFIEVDSANYVYIRYMAISSGFETDQTLFLGNEKIGKVWIYKSTDGGLSFNPIPMPLPIFALALSPEYPSDQTVFAGSPFGVCRSQNGGGSFSRVGPNLVINGFCVSKSYANDGTVFAGASGNGVLRSTDHGATWKKVNTGLDNTVIAHIDISPDFISDGTVFASTKSRGIFKSTDRGDTWSYSGMDGSFSHRVAISPAFPTDHTIFLGTWNGVFRSLDSGANWERVLKIRHYENDSEFVYYPGTWGVHHDPLASGSSMALTDEAGAQARLFVSGTSIKWIGGKNSFGGIADLYVDEVYQGQVDLYSPQAQWQEVLFSISGLPAGSHSIRIVATGTKSPASMGEFVFVDAFEADY
jgi:photosystem II stability/assembly factor-like uncharacterized protein